MIFSRMGSTSLRLSLSLTAFVSFLPIAAFSDGPPDCSTDPDPNRFDPVKLAGDTGAGIRVAGYEITSGGDRVVYELGDALIHSIPILGGTATPLAPVPVDTFRLTPDGSTVVYTAERDSPGVLELYAVAAIGGTATKLNSTLVEGGAVAAGLGGFAIAADGATVVYRADQDVDETVELYAVPLGGGSSTKLNSPLVADGDVTSFVVSPDSTGVAYIADRDVDDVFELLAVSIAGGMSTRLNGPLVSDGDVSSFSISPDSQRVVYRADEDTNNVFELYSVPTGGGSSVKLNHPLGLDETVLVQAISPDGSRVVYRATTDPTFTFFELYSVPIAGGSAIQLDNPGLDVLLAAAITPDSGNLLYLADDAVPNDIELFRVPLVGGAPMRLNCALPPGGDVTAFRITPNATTVIYVAGQDDAATLELYTVPVGGGDSTKLNGPLQANGDVLETTPRVSPEGFGVVYLADQDTDHTFELYRTTIEGPPSIRLNDPLPAFDLVKTARISSDAVAVVYLAGGSTSGFELFRVLYDSDGDWVSNFCDCADDDDTIFPDAAEVNDGVDNQCPGHAGFGVVDETSGNSGFFNPNDKNEYSWTAQSGAVAYEVARSSVPNFSSGCVSSTTSTTVLVDTDIPPEAALFHYLNRPLSPNLGSWGQDWAGSERLFACP